MHKIYKHHSSPIKNWIKTFILLLFIGSLAGRGVLLRAQSVTDLQTKINTNQTQLKQLNAEINKYRAAILQTRNQSTSLKNELNKLELAKKELVASINKTQKQINLAQLNIQKISSDITTKEKEINQDKKAVAESLRQLHEADNQSLIETLALSSSLSDFWNQSAAYENLNLSLEQKITNLRNNQTQLQTQKSANEAQKVQLTSLQLQLQDQKKITEETSAQKGTLLAETQSQESTYQKLLNDRLKKARAVEDEINQAEAQLHVTLNPSLLPQTGSGVLKWPLDKITITQYFGNTPFATANPSVYNGHGHNGIDLAAPIGTAVKSAGDGIVMGTGNTDLACPHASYGQWVLIKHNNGLSTIYAHLSLIKVTKGQTVQAGQVIAYTGVTGYTTGPHLHFGVYASQGVKIDYMKSKVPACGTYYMPLAPYNSYLNPLSYL